jgi:ribosomal protein S18 acetylase RimI-like enzyme
MSSTSDEPDSDWTEAIQARAKANLAGIDGHEDGRSTVPSVEEYWRVARSAFQYDHTRDAVRAHTVESDILIDAIVDEQLVGFCSCDIVDALDQSALYLNGAAVADGFQRQGIGRALVVNAVSTALFAFDLDEAVAFATTQNPAIVSLLEGTFDLYPQPAASEPVPPEMEEVMAELANWLNSNKPFDPPVMRGRYAGEMIYDSIPDHPYRVYTDEILDYQNGDAVLCAGSVSAPI